MIWHSVDWRGRRETPAGKAGQGRPRRRKAPKKLPDRPRRICSLKKPAVRIFHNSSAESERLEGKSTAILTVPNEKGGVNGMGINLSKGQRIDLTKTNPGLTRAIVGLGWDTNRYTGGSSFDLDASAFLADENGKCKEDSDFIFYNQLQHPSGGVEHTGDNRTGEGDGDDEQIMIDFSKVPSHVHRIAIAVTIHDAEQRSQNFGQVSNAFARVVNEENGQEILRFDLGEDFSVETAVVICELYRHGGEWKFNAIGSGFSGGLAALCRNFGLDV